MKSGGLLPARMNKPGHGPWVRSVRGLLPLLLYLAAYDGMGQPALDSSAYARTTIFASGLGNGLLYSINWDHRWRVRGTRWMSVSAGLTFYPGRDVATGHPVISLPMQWNWFRGRRHHREHGAGLTYGSGWYGGWSIDGQPLSSQGIYLFTKAIGYRFQRPNGGFFMRVNILAWARIIELNQRYVEAYGYWETPPIFPWLGLDLGYTFRHRLKTDRP